MTEPLNYQSKPVPIQAMFYSGGAASATPIIDWVLSEDGTARWHEERWFDTIVRSDGIALNSSRQVPVPEHITIDSEVSTFIRPQQWVCLSEGVFFVCDITEFAEIYEPKLEAPVV